jgi:outer membrane receptor protein involved in Fe transport
MFRRGVVILALLAVVLPLNAQQGTTDIRGRVLGPDGASLPGATVMVRNEETGMYRQTTTDQDGVYVISGITPGTYELTAELSGFNSFRRQHLRLEVGKTATVDAPLLLGATSEEVTVTAAAPVVDVTSKDIGGNISAKELIELPSVNRNFIGFVGLLPGVVPSISTESFGSDSVSVNGQDARNNNYMVDGGNNNDDVIGQRAGTQARTPIEAIQEFQVLTGQYDPEFGRTTGAIINAVTRQGTNEFKGVAFTFLQDASYTEKDFFAKQLGRAKPDTKFLQWGGNFGGPIVRDRLHFFVNLERVENDRGTTINIPTRTEFNTATTTEDRVWNTMVRLDGQWSSSQSAAIRWLRESSPQLNQIIPVGVRQVTLAANREESDIDQTAVANWTAVFGNSKLNNLRLTWTQENVAFASAGFNGNGRRQDLLSPTLQFQTFIDQQSSTAQARINDAYYIDDAFSFYTNRHDLRFGVSLAKLTQASDTQDNLNGTFAFSRSDRPFNASDPTTYPDRLTVRVPGSSLLDLEVKYYGLFVQDRWSISNNLTLSFGARYDLERLPIDETDNPFFSDPDDYPVDSNNIAPRLGFSYSIGQGRPTVVRGGVGRFYDKTHLELITGVVSNGVFSDSFTVNFPTNAPDPGPSQGNLPTDPFLVNGPVVNRALLAQLFPPGSRIRNTGTIIFDNPDRVIPYADQFSIGAQRELAAGLAISLDLIHGEGRDQFMSFELNPLIRNGTARTDPVRRATTAYPASALLRGNYGETTYDAAEFQLDHHLGTTYQYRVSYTYSRSEGNTSGNGTPINNFQTASDLNLDLNEGPTDFDRPHNFVFSGSWHVPRTGGLTLATVTRYLSGDAFTVFDSSFDPDRNGILIDPLPAGDYAPLASALNPYPVHSGGGRNGARGPDFFQVDLRAGYRLGFRDLGVELFAELFNATNRVNYASPSGDMASVADPASPGGRRVGNANFLNLTTLRAGGIPRTGQFGVRVSF